jgi:hypothetical protein
VFIASLYGIDKAIEGKHLKECPLAEIVLEQYHEFRPLFIKVLADRLPPLRHSIDHEVQLTNCETPTCGPLYLM